MWGIENLYMFVEVCFRRYTVESMGINDKFLSFLLVIHSQD